MVKRGSNALSRLNRAPHAPRYGPRQFRGHSVADLTCGSRDGMRGITRRKELGKKDTLRHSRGTIFQYLRLEYRIHPPSDGRFC